MRDGAPPSSPRSTSTYSTSTLLKEISSLRNRLKELEEDTRSSVSDDRFAMDKEGDVLNALRKELAKVEHEKASLEKEFMNQMSSLASEHRKTISEL